MVVEQYKLVLTHRIFDTEDIRAVRGKLEPDYTTEFNIAFGDPVPKTEIYKKLLYEMERGLMRGTE